MARICKKTKKNHNLQINEKDKTQKNVYESIKKQIVHHFITITYNNS